MNILEEFWYGNIEPAEYDISSSKEYKELLQLISRNEDKLLATMTEEQKELFTKYADCVREYQVMAECLLFQNSFRLDGRMMLEVMSIISANDLCLWYGNFQALKNINIEIPEHSITALIGPSGCGKSTFLKTLNRMNDLIPTVKITGEVMYGGQNIFDTDVNHLRREVGMVFQKPNPFPMSIYDNIAYGPRTHGITSKAQIDEIVEKALRSAAIWDEVKDRLKKNALGLSGGQQQRLCIARALAVEPKVLLMDEPTSALDPISTSRIEDLAMELKKDYTIVIVTHNMQQAVRISDQTAFFLLGDLVEYGNTEEMFSQPKDKRTEDYITGRFG